MADVVITLPLRTYHTTLPTDCLNRRENHHCVAPGTLRSNRFPGRQAPVGQHFRIRSDRSNAYKHKGNDRTNDVFIMAIYPKNPII